MERKLSGRSTQDGQPSSGKLNIVICGAGIGKRMRSFGTKGLIKLNDEETILSRQIRLFQTEYPESKIVVVTGFQAQRVIKSLPEGVEYVINNDHENTNVARSMLLGLYAFPANEPTLICYGDLVFNAPTISANNLDLSHSHAILSTAEQAPGDVGATVVDGEITTFSFGLTSLTWAHIVLLAPFERSLFINIASEPHRQRQYGHEILNEVIERGGTILSRTPPKLQIVEISSSKDMPKAMQIK